MDKSILKKEIRVSGEYYRVLIISEVGVLFQEPIYLKKIETRSLFHYRTTSVGGL